jgi:eukaryotic-like serine/threonine-protein kinase
VADEEPVQTNKVNEYLLVSTVATGKTTVIWEAIHEATNQPFALKMLLTEALKDADEKALLKHEAKVAQTLEHPNLNRCHGVVLRKTECYLILDLFKAPNLKQFIHNDRDGVIQRFSQLVEGVCLGLAHMHSKGWVHLDLKPDNILLSRSGEVRIIDYSLGAKIASPLQVMLAGSGKKGGVIRGTRSYLAPETIRKQPATAATDIYSLGVTFFECVTGTTPFKGDTPGDLLRKHIAAEPPLPSMYNPDVTPELDAFIHKMMAKKPKSRFQSMEEVLTEFRRIQPFKLPAPEEEEAAKEAAAAASSSGEKSADELELEELMANRRGSREDALITALLDRSPALKARYESIKAEMAAKKAAKEADLKRRLAAADSKSGSKKPAEPSKPAAAPRQPVAQQGMPPQMMPPGFGYPQMPPGYGQPQMPPGYGQPQMAPGYGQPQMPPGYGQPQMPPGYGYAQMPPGYPPQPYGMPPNNGMPVPAYPPGQYPPAGVAAPAGYPPGAPSAGQPAAPAGVQPPVPGAAPQAVPAPPGQQPAAPAPQTPAVDKKNDGLEFMMELPDIE